MYEFPVRFIASRDTPWKWSQLIFKVSVLFQNKFSDRRCCRLNSNEDSGVRCARQWSCGVRGDFCYCWQWLKCVKYLGQVTDAGVGGCCDLPALIAKQQMEACSPSCNSHFRRFINGRKFRLNEDLSKGKIFLAEFLLMFRFRECNFCCHRQKKNHTYCLFVNHTDF